MSYAYLNETTKNAILRYLDNKSGTQVKSQDLNPKARYNPATLINSWYDDRLQSVDLPKSDEPFVSEYLDSYRELCNYSTPDRFESFKMKFNEQGLGQELLMDHQGFAYYNNFTTTYDLCFNHLKKNLCGPSLRKYRKGRYLPETDLSLIYGNLTQWGLKDNIIPKPKSKLVCKSRPMEGEYAAEYISYDRAEVKKLNDSPYWGKKKSELMATRLKK